MARHEAPPSLYCRVVMLLAMIDAHAAEAGSGALPLQGRWYALNDFTTREGGIVTLIYDVTDLEQVEQRLRESQPRSAFPITSCANAAGSMMTSGR